MVELLSSTQTQDIEAGIHVHDVSSDAAREVGAQEGGGITDFLGGDGSPQGACLSTCLSMVRKCEIPDAARVWIGPAEMALTLVPSGPSEAAR